MAPRGADPFALIIVGASVRSLADSARRAGWIVHAADLFADADLRAAAAVAVRVPTGPHRPWPSGLEESLRNFPLVPWLYSGALENHPDLVDRLARSRPLAGNAGDCLRAVRDPATLAAAVRAAGLGFPETHDTVASIPDDGSFLVKPRTGAGGRGIAPWHGGPPPAGDVVWQRRVPGRVCSVAFVLGPGGARLFGASRQLVGRRWCCARGFAWCGAVDVALTALDTRLRPRLERLGTMLRDEFGLVGLVGVDLVLDAAGDPSVIEVNPRPTSSLELVERATGESVVATHLAACGIEASPPTAASGPVCRPAAWAKAVVFSTRPLMVDEALEAALAAPARRWTTADGGWPALADLPRAETAIAEHAPVLTVFASAGDATAALRALRGRVAAVRAILAAGFVSPPGGAAAQPPRRPRGRTA